MGMQGYQTYTNYIKATGFSLVLVGGCWFLYQLRQLSQILQASVPTNVLSKEQPQSRYIYIDHPRFKDVFIFRKVENLQSSVPGESLSFARAITKWCKSFNRKVANKLLGMARHADIETDRFRALRALNSLNHLRDWHYRHIAQMLDAKTAISLARIPNVDARFFLNPPYYRVRHKLHDVIENMHRTLLRLSAACENTHPCLIEFLNKKFKDTPPDSLILDHDLTNLGLAVAPATVWDPELLQSCVQTLYHHSCLEQYSKDIIHAGGLPLLMLIKRIFLDNTDVCILLAKIISNISLHSECLEDIFQAGWIGTLVEWSRSNDIRLSVPASRALANLDADENESVKYPRRIYLLHPLHKTRAKTKLDVVFFHGLLGGVFVTWRQRDVDASQVGVVDPRVTQDGINFSNLIDDQSQEFLKDLARDLRKREWDRTGEDFEVILDDCPQNTDSRASGPFFLTGDDACMKKINRDKQRKTQCWPKDWLPEDVPFLRVIGVNYDTNVSMWTPSCPIEGVRTGIRERSKEYLKKLLTAAVGRRPTIWVCHSMGGLLVKKMLVDEWKNGDRNDICKNTRSIIFYSTPHRGSRVAALKQPTQMVVWPSIEVLELREESPQLLELHNDFLDMLKEHPIEIISFVETKPTHVTPLKVPFQFVTSNSADPGVGEFYEIAQDHLSICKPANRHSFLYQKLLDVLRRHVPAGEKTATSPIMGLSSLPSKLF